MEKNTKKILVFALFGLFVLVFAMQFVAASPPLAEEFVAAQDSIIDKLRGGNYSFLSSGFSGDSEAGMVFTRVLLILLVALLVYAISDVLPFLSGKGKEPIKAGISIIVAILSFIYVGTNTIKTLLVNYEALGIALTTIIPLIIVITFIVKLSSQNPFISVIVSPIISVVFIIYSVYKWLTMPASALQVIYLITAIIWLIWLFMFKSIMKWIGAEKIKTLKDAFKEEIELQGYKRKTEVEDIKG